MRTCWLSLLLAPGAGLVKTSDYKHVLMTMHVTRWGIIAWRMVARKSGEFKYFVFKEYASSAPLP